MGARSGSTESVWDHSARECAPLLLCVGILAPAYLAFNDVVLGLYTEVEALIEMHTPLLGAPYMCTCALFQKGQMFSIAIVFAMTHTM